MKIDINKSKKKILLIVSGCFLFSGASVFAQNIELPEVTTVISGDTEKAGSDTLPDFSDVLKLPKGSGDVEPVLPGVETSSEPSVSSASKKPADKSVYAEGLIGGGFPMMFTGNISVFRSVGESPFKFSFEHDSALCYSNHAITENFSDRTTKLEVDKSYKKNNFKWGANGVYKNTQDGLQGNIVSDSQVINLLNRDAFSAAGNISYTFKSGFETGASASFDYYNRYTEQACSDISAVTYFQIAPELFAVWRGYGFDTGLSVNYSFSDEISQRAEFKTHLEWKNDYIRVYGSASAVIGNLIKDKPVIVPFTVGIDSSFPVYFANRRFSILAEGGINSYRPSVHELEDKYKFTQINYHPSETSDWYGKLSFTIPLKSAFTGNAVLEYRQTAYDNGVWQPDYDDSSNYYFFYENAHQMFITDFSVSYHYEGFGISGSWHSNWMDVPVLESKQAVKLAVNYQDGKGRWGADLSASTSINAEVETPVINAGGFVRITPSVRAILSVNDLIKLYKAETRTYAGRYAARGGSATLMLKFFF